MEAGCTKGFHFFLWSPISALHAPESSAVLANNISASIIWSWVPYCVFPAKYGNGLMSAHIPKSINWKVAFQLEAPKYSEFIFLAQGPTSLPAAPSRLTALTHKHCHRWRQMAMSGHMLLEESIYESFLWTTAILHTIGSWYGAVLETDTEYHIDSQGAR